MKKRCIMLIAAMFLLSLLSACQKEQSNVPQSYMYKDTQQVELDIERYLHEKYGKEFVVAIKDNPNHIYSSYAASAYAANDGSKEMFDVTIAYSDKETYVVTDDYFMYSISDDMVAWFTELADPYIDCEFKVFFYPSGFAVPSDYKDCKSAEDFLELSPTASYYGLIFKIILPSTEIDSPINEICDSIAKEMLNQKIRGQVGIRVYEDENVYNLTETKDDVQYFRINEYKYLFCTSTVGGDFSFNESEIHLK